MIDNEIGIVNMVIIWIDRIDSFLYDVVKIFFVFFSIIF